MEQNASLPGWTVCCRVPPLDPEEAAARRAAAGEILFEIFRRAE